jgi:hypothetical protein
MKPKAIKVFQRNLGRYHAALGVMPKSDNPHYLNGYSRQYVREQIATARKEVF